MVGRGQEEGKEKKYLLKCPMTEFKFLRFADQRVAEEGSTRSAGGEPRRLQAGPVDGMESFF